MQCAESMRVQAYFDDEVDAVSAADIERHVEHCAECRALLQDLEQVRRVLRRDGDFTQAPPALRARITLALDAESVLSDSAPRRRTPAVRLPRSFWNGAFSGVTLAAVLAALSFFIWVPRQTDPLLDEIVNAHVRSLMPTHLIEVVSTDRHTVKPWFAGRADVSPVVADFQAQGYRLVGGRADYLAGQHAAVVVYQHGPHVINVFSWVGKGRASLPDTTRNGYHFAFWSSGNIQYCAVSDTAWDELLGLTRLLRDLGTRDTME